VAKQTRLRGPDTFSVPIVGEASYQSNIVAIVGKGRTGTNVKFVDADLILENSNPYDKMAVRIDINGKTVGYLSREYARQYRQRLTEAGIPEETATCRAKIVGGSPREGERGRYGVWIDLPVVIGPLSK
jgi:hypothetical protein